MRSFCGEVEKIDGLERIRFMTSHPKDLSDELIRGDEEFQKDLPVICICRSSPAAAGS